MAYDEYFPDDETLKRNLYKEYKLSEAEEASLKDIETQLKNRKIDSSNRDELLEYLESLHSKIMKVKEAEYSYEGEHNLNINRYLQRIKKLAQEIERA
jgi:hypothetical protein